ncbi:MAG: DUF6056 family protein [Synergistaceae bacterium]|nr:DUF6056 family protein [Synergistaceae bacterium]
MNKAKIWTGLGLFSVYIGLFAYISRFSSPAGDDFPMANVFRSVGFLETLNLYWLNLGGRLTGTFITVLGNAAGIMDHYYILAPLALIVSLSSMYFLVTSLFDNLAAIKKLFIAFLLQSVWLAAAIELKQSLYWFAGQNYYWTGSFFLIEFALTANIYKDKNTKLCLSLLVVMIFLNSGMSELSAAYQVPMFAGAAFISWMSDNKKCAKYMLIMLCAALAGLGLQILNPGNVNRTSEFLAALGPNPAPNTKNFFMTYRVAVISGLITSYHFFTRPIIYALLLFMPIISDNVKQPKFIEKMPFRFKIWHIFLFETVTACCFQAVGGYAMGNALYLRAMSVVRWIMLAQWILFFVFLYRNSNFTERIRGIWIYRFKEVILLICLLMSTNFSLLRADLGIASEYSRQLSERREYIKEQKALGNLDIVVPKIDEQPQLFRGSAIPGREHPQAYDYAHYYKLNSIMEGDPLIIEAITQGKDSENEELKQLRAAAEAGDEEAIFFFNTIEGDGEVRIKLIISLAEQGDSDAQFILARYHDTSDRLTSPYIQKNDAIALSYYFKLAELGHRKSRDLLWTFYMGGFRTDRDLDIIIWGLSSMFSPF